jgi:hypothetical protein
MRRDSIVVAVWEIWTKNGLRLDADQRSETEKTVQDAVNNTYVDDIQDGEWMDAALKRLGVE